VNQKLLIVCALPTMLCGALAGCDAAVPAGAVSVSANVVKKKSSDANKETDSGATDSVVAPGGVDPSGVAAGGGDPGGGDPGGGGGAAAGAGGGPDAGGAAGAGAGGGAGAGAGGGGAPVMPAGPNLRWIVMGDFGLESLGAVPDCAAGTQQRSVCSGENSRCRSTFATTCSSPDCRRLFKCTTGQTNSLVWFPMGDGFTTSATGLSQCGLGMNIAGSPCTAVNDRCLSSFCTSGSGPDCGRRVFKCLTSGVEGQLFYRWMGDKPLAEIAGIPQCALTENIAGSRCVGEDSRCVSSFFTDASQSKRRLFKCTP
jgi:hypothetical protein